MPTRTPPAAAGRTDAGPVGVTMPDSEALTFEGRTLLVDALCDAHALGYLTHPASYADQIGRAERRRQCRVAQARSTRALVLYLVELERRRARRVGIGRGLQLVGKGAGYTALAALAWAWHPAAGAFVAAAYVLELGRWLARTEPPPLVLEEPTAAAEEPTAPPALPTTTRGAPN